MDSMMQDVRAALRGLARNRGFAAAVILTMALGIGANSAIFSVVHGVLLRPLPYANGDDILILRQQRPLAGIQAQGFSPLEMDDYRQQSKTLESIVEYHNMWFVLLGRGEPERVATGVVSWNYFDLFGVKPVAGRTFRSGRRRARGRRGAGPQQRLLEEPLRRRSERRRAGLRDERSPAHRHRRAAADSAVPRRERRLHAGVGVSLPIVGGRPHEPQRAHGAGVRPAAAGRDARRRIERPGHGRLESPAGLPGELPGERGIHRDGGVAPRRADARLPADALDSARRRGLPPAHRVRQRRQPDARAAAEARARNGDSDVARRGPLAPRPSAPDRKHAARARAAPSSASSSRR